MRRVWFGFVLNLAVYSLLDTSFTDWFTHEIFPSDQNIVPWHSHPITIWVSHNHSKPLNPTTAIVNTPADNNIKIVTKVAETETETPTAIQLARQVLLKPYTDCRVMVFIWASDIHTIEARILEGVRRLMFAAHGVIEVFRTRPFYIFISNISPIAMYVRKHMMAAYATRPPTSMMTASSPFHYQPRIGTLEKLNPLELVENFRKLKLIKFSRKTLLDQCKPGGQHPLFYTHERRTSLLLNTLPQAQSCSYSKIVSHTSCGWKLRLALQCNRILDARC